MDTDSESQNYPLPFKSGVFEIQDQTHSQSRDSQIIQHLAPLVVGDAINYLRVHNHTAKSDQVGNKLTDFDPRNKTGNRRCWSNVTRFVLNSTTSEFS